MRPDSRTKPQWAMRRIAAVLAGRKIGGFTTEEIREKGERVGFGLESFDGARAVLAHVEIASAHPISRYGVDLAALDRFVDSTLDPAAGPDVFLVDEIGKMECLSLRFVAAIERVKRRQGAVLWTMTRANREEIPGRVRQWLGTL